MSKNRYKTHFPRPSLQRTLCGKYITRDHDMFYWNIRFTADFSGVNCPDCRNHNGFLQALCDFEIGEYSLSQWLKKYEAPEKGRESPLHHKSEAAYKEWLAKAINDRQFREDLLRKFEARAKKT